MRTKNQAIILTLNLLFSVFLLTPFGAFSQNIDSILMIWNDANQEDTVRFNAVNGAIYSYYNTNLDSAASLARHQLEFAKEKQLEKGVLQAIRNLVDVHYYQAAPSAMLPFLEEGISESQAQKDSASLSYFLRMYGVMNGLLGKGEAAIEKYQESLSISKAMNDSAEIARVLNSIGATYVNPMREYDSGILYIQRSIELKKRLSTPQSVANSTYNLGAIYYEKGDLISALNHFLECQKIFEEINDSISIMDVYIGIGNLYDLQDEKEKAISYYEKCLNRAKATNREEYELLANLNLGNLHVEKKQLDLARTYLEPGLDLAKKLGNPNYIAYAYYYRGSLESESGNFDLAESFLGEASNMGKEVGDKSLEAQAAIGLGHIFLQRKQFPTSITFLKKGERLALEIGENLLLRSVYLNLKDYYQQTGNPSKELDAYEAYVAYKDSIFNEKAIRETTQRQMAYDYEKQQFADSLEFVKQQAIQAAEFKRRQLIGNGSFIGIIVLIIIGFLIYRNVQQQKNIALEKERTTELERLDRLKDQFLANTSHELRTPLHGIIGLAEAMYEKTGDKSDTYIQNNLGMMIASGHRLSNLINDLLDFSRMKNQDLQLQSKSISLHAVVVVVLHSVIPLIGSKSLELKNEIPENFSPVLADENRLQQILFNLIGNAIKFTHEGHITLRAKLLPDNQGRDKMVAISIQDTGIGIPKDKQDTIFQSFEQADGDTTREYGGTGLGLAITKHLVELHGGTISVDSVPQKGSTFTFSLPLADSTAMIPISATLSQRRSILGISKVFENQPIISSIAHTGKVRILVVDDEPINHEVLRNHLSNDQYDLTSVMSGQEAIQVLDEGQTFDLILLDVMMPRISGYEVCKKIREKYLPSELPIIMVTAKNQISDLVAGLSLGANDYLAKPFSRDEFLARIKTQIDLHRINAATGRFVPGAFLRALNKERITEVMLGDHVERNVAVLFTDIRGYTTLSENMSPEENFQFVNDFHGRMGPIIQKHNGFINQYLGDGIMALFPGQAEDGLRASIEMQKVLSAFNSMRAEEGKPPISMGLGLHRGSLIMGVIGDEKRMDAATIADTVNTASRIESLTKHYGVSFLLSEEGLAEIEDKDRFHFRYLGKVLVKGKKVPLNIYECLNGEEESSLAKKMSTLSSFDKGVSHFFEKQFSQAVAEFSKVLEKDPDDQAAKLFLNKSSKLMMEGTPEDWTGIEKMLFK